VLVVVGGVGRMGPQISEVGVSHPRRVISLLIDLLACGRITRDDFGKSTVHSKPNQSIENLVGRDKRLC
jgi:hypothetical protein